MGEHGQCRQRHQWLPVLHNYSQDLLARRQARGFRQSSGRHGCGTEGGEHQDGQPGQAPEGCDHCRLWQDRSGETLCHCQGVERASGTSSL
ncbi:peptidylprolyl isomerase B, isoform CRA_c [Rattus norvegicus]|uniref:Peptidylprolyl isomerase B, isoform CRA_c n=1 Tax=Rattus norvegicus TaxID=10116 RepID=A6J5H3_RAT|nr:peptidylprolyl isomerase B, isoform CRA_c [Rattus norvegicus]